VARSSAYFIVWWFLVNLRYYHFILSVCIAAASTEEKEKKWFDYERGLKSADKKNPRTRKRKGGMPFILESPLLLVCSL
jgi:hypothetical protein